MLMHIQAKDLILKRQSIEDESIEDILHDPLILQNLAESRTLAPQVPPNICFSIEKDGEVIGQVCLKGIRWINRKGEISLFIKKDMQSKGFGLQALRAIIAFGFKRLNLYRLEAEVIAGNIASEKLIKKCGFQAEGRLREAKFVNGAYHDLLRFGLLKKEYQE